MDLPQYGCFWTSVRNGSGCLVMTNVHFKCFALLYFGRVLGCMSASGDRLSEHVSVLGAKEYFAIIRFNEL